jgi:putative ABC transport system ATP-binding protein
MTPSVPTLSVTGLRHQWPGHSSPILNVPLLALSPGDTVFLHGPSGCGKSTLLALLAGVLPLQQGEVQWFGQARPRRGLDAWRGQHLGLVFQQFNLLPYLSALDNVLLPCRLSAHRHQQARAAAGSANAQATQLLVGMGLPPELHPRPAAQLSIGQQQRVAAARALIGRPGLVLADEPTSALDEATRDLFMHTWLEQTRQAGCAMLFVSHDLRLAPHFQRQLSWHGLQGGPA